MTEELYMEQENEDYHVSMYHVDFGNDEEGNMVYSWRVDVWDQDREHETSSSWDKFDDAEWYFNEHCSQYVNTKRY